MDDIEETNEALKRLGRKIPRGCLVGVTAADAPWNKTGHRFWAVTDGAGHEIVRADTSDELESKLEQRKVSV